VLRTFRVKQTYLIINGGRDSIFNGTFYLFEIRKLLRGVTREELKYLLTKLVQVKVVAVIQCSRFAVNVIPVVANLILLIERRVVRAEKPEILKLKKEK
jgi:hypothetical protein